MMGLRNLLAASALAGLVLAAAPVAAQDKPQYGGHLRVG